MTTHIQPPTHTKTPIPQVLHVHPLSTPPSHMKVVVQEATLHRHPQHLTLHCKEVTQSDMAASCGDTSTPSNTRTQAEIRYNTVLPHVETSTQEGAPDPMPCGKQALKPRQATSLTSIWTPPFHYQLVTIASRANLVDREQ